MATKSFLKNIRVRGQKQARAFIFALEQSKAKKDKDVKMSRPVSDMTADEMNKIFLKSKVAEQ